MSAADFYASMNARLGLEHGQALKVLNAALDLLTHNGTQVPCTSSHESGQRHRHARVSAVPTDT